MNLVAAVVPLMKIIHLQTMRFLKSSGVLLAEGRERESELRLANLWRVNMREVGKSWWTSLKKKKKKNISVQQV